MHLIFTGMLDAGLGERKINTVLSASNIATVPNATLKRYERLVGDSTEVLAKKTCVAAIEKEKQLAIKYKS